MFHKTIKTIVLLLAVSVCATPLAQAAFPVKTENTLTKTNVVSGEMIPVVALNQTKRAHSTPGPAPKKTVGKTKSHIAAILLCFFLGGFGIHRFYLGYDWQGILQAWTYPLMIIGLVIWAAAMVGTTTVALPPAALSLFLVATALSIWEFIDFIRIIIKDLKPVNGEYN